MTYSVYVVGGDYAIEKMYKQRGYKIIDDADKADIIQFTGGADVDPSVYGDSRNPTTGSNLRRDQEELKIFEKYKDASKLKVGICRGSQFVCAASGGKLWQDVDRHAIGDTHPIIYYDEDGKPSYHEVTSTHHQMMDPRSLLVWAQSWGVSTLSSYRDKAESKRNRTDFAKHGPDQEIVFFLNTSSYGFQGHPEYGVKECEDIFFIGLERAKKLQERFVKEGSIAPSKYAINRLEALDLDDEEQNMDNEEDNFEDPADDDDGVAW